MFSFRKSILSIVLLTAFLLQIFSTAIIYLDYYINQDYFAKVLCVNKDKPQLHCNGQCHLNAELEKDKKDQTPFSPVKVINKIQLFSENTEELCFISSSLLTEPITYYNSPLLDKHTPVVFHPPTA